jgi:NADH-quinone oxidoreductase subunit C
MIQFQAPNLSTVKQALESRGATQAEILDDSVHCVVGRERAFDVIRSLKEDPGLGFKYFTDITGADYSKYSEPQPERFAVIYSLLSPSLGVRLQLRVYLPESDPSIASITSLFAGANWGEREVYDMYGFDFRGHPSLQRLLTPEGFEGHALRKDYPLKGRGERSSFPVYEAVTGHAE